jgi:hypothetical protein
MAQFCDPETEEMVETNSPISNIEGGKGEGEESSRTKAQKRELMEERLERGFKETVKEGKQEKWGFEGRGKAKGWALVYERSWGSEGSARRG